jgi:hypothetical protein
MSDLRTAAQQALEALQNCANGEDDVLLTRDALAALRAALAEEALQRLTDVHQEIEAALEQPEQAEPVANNPDPYHLSRILHELAGSASMCWDHVDRAGVFQSTQAADVVAAALAEIRQRMKDAPPRREWRGLTQGEHEKARHVCRHVGVEGLVLWLEDKLKERNA